MDSAEYRAMFCMEENHWWYKGMRDLLFSTIARNFKNNKKIRILDVGCGTGINLKYLSRLGSAYGIDISEEAINFCSQRTIRNALGGTAMQIPFKEGSFDLVISTDVLCHNRVTCDVTALNEIYDVLKDGGIFIINLPAYGFIKRQHDIRVHTRHRYLRSELRFLLEESKFKIIKISYRNLFLFFIFLLLKFKNNKITEESTSDLKPVNDFLNSFLYNILRIENFILRILDVPLGTSIFCVSVKLPNHKNV